MKKSTFCVILALIPVIFAGCAPKKPEVTRPEEPSRQIFEEAERRYRQSEYQQALDLYRRYAENYPEADRVPAAYLKQGVILAEQGRYEKARRIYEKVAENYPDSPYAGEALIKAMETFAQQGRFRDVISYRKTLPDKRLDPEIIVRADVLEGDAFMTIEDFRGAWKAFASACSRGGRDKCSEITDRLLAAAARLESDFIEAELERLRTEPAAAVLMYQHGINLMAERRLEEASSYFRRFLDNYPEHSLAGRAKEQMVTMTSAAFFQRGTIGCVLPLSGRYEKIGRQALRGMELALSEASDGREDQGIPLRVLIRDSKSDPETARKAVEELAGRHVAAIAGPIETAPQAAQAAQDQRLPIIVMSQRDTVAETGEYVFNNFITPQMQVDAVTRYAMGRLGCRNFAVLFPDEGYGRTYLDLFGRRLAEEKARLVGAEPYNPEHTDFAGPIKKLAGLYYGLPADIESQRLQGERLETMAESAGLHGKLFGQNILPWMQPTGADAGERYGYGELMIDKPAPRVNFEAVFIPDSPEKAGLIIPQLRYYDINNAFLLGTNLWHSQKLIDIAGDHAGKAVIPEGFFAESRRPGVREFVDKFEKVYGYEPGFLEAVGYDTAMILFEQISDETVFNRPALGRALSEMPAYRGLTGRTGFTATGTADKSLYLLTVSRGRFVEITE